MDDETENRQEHRSMAACDNHGGRSSGSAGKERGGKWGYRIDN